MAESTGAPTPGADALADLRSIVRKVEAGDFVSPLPHWKLRQGPPRQAAVLILIGGANGGMSAAHTECDVVLIERSMTLSDHAGQVAFPGGGVEAGDESLIATALREAEEETGVDPTGVLPLGELPPSTLAISNFQVTPVLAWWSHPSRVYAVDTAESARAVRVPIAELIDPSNRAMAQIHRTGRSYESPCFEVAGLFIWGYTGTVLSHLLDELGWAVPWDMSRKVPAER